MLSSLKHVKSLHSSLEIMFDKEDVQIQVSLWLLHLDVIQQHKDYSMDTEEFIELDNGYRKLRMSKRKEYETKIETYKEQREKVLTLVNVIKETNTFEQL